MPASQASLGEEARSPQGLYLLFAPGARPQRSDVLAMVEALDLVWVSHDPASSPVDPQEAAQGRDGYSGQWLELMMSGLTFDLLGMAPAPGVAVPQVVHRVALGAECDPHDKEAMVLVPGPHLADGANSLPIVRAMLDLGCKMARRLDGVEAICWSPARSATATELFCRSVEGWTEGGPFPALGLTSFAANDAGHFASEGLGFFVGQELRFHPTLAQDRLAATRLGMRLVHDMVSAGRVDEAREFVTEDGARYTLSPVPDSDIVEVSRM